MKPVKSSLLLEKPELHSLDHGLLNTSSKKARLPRNIVKPETHSAASLPKIGQLYYRPESQLKAVTLEVNIDEGLKQRQDQVLSNLFEVQQNI